MTPATAERQEALTTVDGITINALLAPHPSPVGMMLLCHGMTTDHTEHGAFNALRDYALRAGLAVARFDLRAHGRSGGTNEELRLAGVRRDVDAVMSWLDEQVDEAVPLIPLGVSFGGAAAAHATTAERPCAGVAFWYAVVDYLYQYGVDSPVEFTRMMRSAHGREDPKWSAMPVLGTSYHIPAALLEELADDPTRELIERLTVPVMSYHGSRDKFVDPTPLCTIATRRSNFDLRTAWGAGHGFLLWRRRVIRQTVAFAFAAARGWPGAARSMPVVG